MCGCRLQPTEYPSLHYPLSKHIEEYEVASKINEENRYKAFWATVEKWWCNMANYLEKDPLPMQILNWNRGKDFFVIVSEKKTMKHS